MSRQIHGRRALGAVVAVLVTGAATASFAVASGPVSEEITACVHHQTGALRVIDPATQRCRPQSESQISWDRQGAQGIPGRDGAEGPSGPAGPAGEGCTIVDNQDETVTLTCGDDMAVLSGHAPYPPTVSIWGPGPVDEGRDAELRVVLSAPYNKPVSVDYATLDGTATAPDDYVPAAGTVVFDPGQTAKTVVVATVNDTADEPTESFSVVLSNAVNAHPEPAVAEVSLSDWDCAEDPSLDSDEPDTRAAAYHLGSFSGDRANEPLSREWSGTLCEGDEDWFSFTLTEEDFSWAQDLQGRVYLALWRQLGSGTQELHVYVGDDELATESSEEADVVYLDIEDDPDADDTTTVFIQVVGNPRESSYNSYVLGVEGR